MFASNETVDEVRARLAVARGSTEDDAATVGPELWLCDAATEAPTVRTDDAPKRILEWTRATCAPALFECHPGGARKAVLVFTFPPARSTYQARSRRARAALVVPFSSSAACTLTLRSSPPASPHSPSALPPTNPPARRPPTLPPSFPPSLPPPLTPTPRPPASVPSLFGAPACH